jgi:hypothetical protein
MRISKIRWNKRQSPTKDLYSRKFRFIIFTIDVMKWLIPIFVLYIASSDYIGNFRKGDNITSDNYKILFTAIGLSATLASLSFSASNSDPDKQRKTIYRNAAEALFVSTIGAVLATICTYASLRWTIAKVEIAFELKAVAYVIKTTLKSVIHMGAGVLFIGALFSMTHAITDLVKLLSGAMDPDLYWKYKKPKGWIELENELQNKSKSK